MPHKLQQHLFVFSFHINSLTTVNTINKDIAQDFVSSCLEIANIKQPAECVKYINNMTIKEF
ncbi:CLUMA_CG004189, isoform A [Clunio marinus]|uniref:CLUMA_CG004189, isoform A n=1 Tax=Clunio marinus TaxID=568069 RepID=A0A1J1HVB8_9DIPT|nr:CLUMA_CG004189, isoform A [Clunio marinus]